MKAFHWCGGSDAWYYVSCDRCKACEPFWRVEVVDPTPKENHDG